VSMDGQQQDNAVHTAIEQLANGFVPVSLNRMFRYNLDFRNVISRYHELRYVPHVTALVPMIVTNAALYRLKPDVTNLNDIRRGGSPSEIADELTWTWHYHEPPWRLVRQNVQAVEKHLSDAAELIYRYPDVSELAETFLDRPNWIAIVNIPALSQVVDVLRERFLALDTINVQKLLQLRRKLNPKKRK